jgi:hypothetical protein
VSASLLEELGYRVEGDPKRRRLGEHSPPRSPTFATDSPDYTPSDAEFDGDRARSRSPTPDYDQRLTEARTVVDLAESKTNEANKALEDLRYRYGRLRSRVIYLEGEIAVYQRLCVN